MGGGNWWVGVAHATPGPKIIEKKNVDLRKNAFSIEKNCFPSPSNSIENSFFSKNFFGIWDFHFDRSLNYLYSI